MKISLSKEERDVLRRLALSESQILLYVTLLNHNVLSVLELSKLTGINRVQIYSEAEKLIDLGLFEIARRDKRKYIAASPTKLVEIAKKQARSAEELVRSVSSIIPNLESLTIPTKGQVITKYYEGVDKIFEAYEEMLRLGHKTEFVSFAGSLDDVIPVMPVKYWGSWNERLQKECKSTIRMLVNYSAVARSYVEGDQLKPHTRYREDFPMKSQLEVFNDVIFINSFKDELGIWIESKVIADSYRVMFEILWKDSKEFSN